MGTLTAALITSLLLGGGAVWTPKEGRSLIGKPAPDIDKVAWLDGNKRSLNQLKGRVVLIRFWLVGCPFCTATAPALNDLHERYRDRGLILLGIHHPKSERAKSAERVRQGAKELGFKFPVGRDNDWHTIRRYGVGTALKRFTSVSFLVDDKGVIRWLHDGGEFHRGGGKAHADCNAAHQSLLSTIDEILPKKRSSP